MKILYLESIEFGAKKQIKRVLNLVQKIKNIKQINTEAKTKGVS